ncbi:hypothetical protein DSM107007_57280 [Nostoc sp. PCC 7120 = FACHB-418]|uniref:thermonuclease family protein n=1 Tax=Nostoc sp. (strain PCC 7120 / SAG 25.82 / UTEX 2576) TaxID=103690 RepID=UPI000F8F62DF|nr:thermonuclease family protein [Nostoc sp. PCC 7120 = FACHB-418]RUR72447.1 hypothetical protein DSM107007_57280 [Nostoc sp. PCC 7120 = FACHB-418]
MNKAAIITAFLVLLSGVPTVAQSNLPSMTVVSVGDGDTLRVRNQQGQAITIRLGCVDAPELKQNPWGQQSKTRLGQLLPVGQSVQVRSIENDKYKRLVAEVFVNNRSVNLTMVQEGQAVVYRQYLQGCDRSYPNFCIPPNSPDLDCGDISYRRFSVNQPDPHGFDRDKDGIGCER